MQLPLSLNIIAIIFELILWVFLFLKFSKELSYYKAMLFADFVITTIDFVLLFTPLRTTILYIHVINKKTGKTIAVIPLTFGIILLIKSALFYLGQEFLPEWMKQLRTQSPFHGLGVEYEQEKRRNLLSTYRGSR